MTELLQVRFLPSDFRNCFFYLNDVVLRNRNTNGKAIKIQFGENHHKTAYASVSLTPLPEIPKNNIGVGSLLARKWDLKEGKFVLVSFCDVDTLSTVEILPVKKEDYLILSHSKNELESHILNQVSVVAERQTLPLYVFSNFPIDVKIGSVNHPSGYGRLEKFTKLVVLQSPEKTDFDELKDMSSTKNGNIDLYYDKLQKMLESNFTSNNAQKEEIYLKHLIKDDTMDLIYKIQPNFKCNLDVLELHRKFIIVPKFGKTKCYDSDCEKILVKVDKVEKKTDEQWGDECDKKNITSIYTYLINLNESQSMTAFCLPYIMETLNIFVGSNISITPVKSTSKNSVIPYKDPIKTYSRPSFWCSMLNIRKNTWQTILNNFKFNIKINTLIVGGHGMGKTFLLDDIAEELASEFIFHKIIQCKSLRGKKIETLHKLCTDAMNQCCKYEPSVLILDDLNCLTHIDEEEGQYNKLFSSRVVDLLTEIIKTFQGKFNISIIASSASVPDLSSFVSTHGPRLFQNVLTIPEMTLDEKKFMLREIILQKVKIPEDNFFNFDSVLTQTSGYTIQDLSDLTEKALFNYLLKNDSEEVLFNLDQSDFDLALSELTPLNLRDVKLKDNIEKKWEDVGGLTEPKKILSEIFSWPLEYPELLESCPLRLQRGVLLYGAPGTGKTLLAGALANKCGLNFISVKGPEVLSKYVGASEEGVRNLFIRAQKTKPCLLFFDEFDSLAPKRGLDSTGVTDRVVNQLLTQLDGVEALNGVWVLAATSRPDLLDVALLRPGRLDKMVSCDVPNQVDRVLILEALSRNLPKECDVDFLEIAEKSEGYTGADLQAVLYTAQMLSIKEKQNIVERKTELKISQKHLLEALSETKPSLSIFERLRYEKLYEKFLRSRTKNREPNYNETQRVTLA